MAERCEPTEGWVVGCTFKERLEDTSYVTKSLFQWEHAVFIVYIMLFLYLARYTYQAKLYLFLRRHPQITGFTCALLRPGRALAGDHHETPPLMRRLLAPAQLPRRIPQVDDRGRQQGARCLLFGSVARRAASRNGDQLKPALADALPGVRPAGYLVATGLILWASMTGLKRGSGNELKNLANIAVFQLLGVVFLEIARIVNDKVLLRRLDNNYELVGKRNIAVGCAEAGSYVGTGLIIMGAVSGPITNWGDDIASSALFFVLGQVCARDRPFPRTLSAAAAAAARLQPIRRP